MRAAIVTGADHGYFHLLQALLRTLTRARATLDCSLCVFDFGLSPDDIVAIGAFDAEVIRPTWWFDVPEHLRLRRNLSYAARPKIPDLFPGYDVYLWLDADISVQDGCFANDFIDAAKEDALAVVEEADPAYRIELYALKWRIGNAFRCYGPAGGLKLCLGRQINSGAFALKADAPHWSVWQQRYREAVMRAGRANLDQHALMATVSLDGLPTSYLESTHNWICARRQPYWDDDLKVFCRPSPPFDPISVLHLAGRQKQGLRQIQTLGGEVKSMPLTYADPDYFLTAAEAVGV